MLPQGFSIANEKDIPQLNVLVNSAYRGETSRHGWTTEADLLDGIRTDEETLKQMMLKPGAVFIKYEEENKILACVYLDKQGDEIYLGMLTVNPLLQAKGIGKKLMKVSEDYARQQNCSVVFMSVVSVRKELIEWYERRGYFLTGETKPFPSDQRFGIQKQPLEFVIMKKELA